MTERRRHAKERKYADNDNQPDSQQAPQSGSEHSFEKLFHVLLLLEGITLPTQM
jgi:hypothetical protein